jgi:glycosyltransferase involved in cell wall biosynthesis
MRILMVNKFHHMLGGVERYIGELTLLLEHEGHEVIPFAMAHPANDPSPYEHYFVSSLNFFDASKRPPALKVAERVIYSREARRKISQLIEAVQPDLAHVHNICHYISPSILDALHGYAVPTLMTLHEYKLICPTYSLWVDGEICERCRGGRYYHCVLRSCSHGSLHASLLNAVEGYVHRALRIYDRVDAFVSPSRFLMRKHVEHGFDPTRFSVIPNFVIEENYTPRFDHDDYFAYVGRLTQFKGVGTLLKAVAQLRPTVPLLIIGDGPARQDLEKQAEQLGLPNARFVGFHSGHVLHNLIRGAMFVVVPSEWYENCPYSVLEAFALGKPVVGADIAGIPELVEHGVDGLLFAHGQAADLAEQMARLLEGPSTLLREFGQAGRAKLERDHNKDTHYARLAALYASLMMTNT